MTKPFDLEDSHPDYRNTKTWTRGMTAESLRRRFDLAQDLLNFYVVNKQPLDNSKYPVCPECKGDMIVVKITLQDGVTNCYYLQCRAHEKLVDHGFSKFSKHGTRGLMGRKPGSKPTPKPAPEQKITPVETKMVVPDRVIHPEVIRATKYVINGERQIYFTGPAGTGKSTGAENMLEIMKGNDKWKESFINMITVSMSTFVSDLAGFLDRLNKGEYLETELVKALRKPSLVVVDEADKGNPNLAGFWNTVLANNKITTPGGTFDRHADNVVLFIGNTTGHAPNKQYSGSVRQDFATLDRFRCFNIEFNETVERAAIPGLNEDLYKLANKIRKCAETSGLQRIIGLRWLRRCNQAMKIEGKGAKETVLQIMKDESWSNDEILASGINTEDKAPATPKTGVKHKYYVE